MATNLLSHRGFNGSIETSLDDDCLHGKILFIDDLITYEGESVPEIKEAFKDAVDRYLAHCEKTGRPANKPYSGTFNVRTGPELHRKAVVAAAKAGKTLNDFVFHALRSYLDHPKGVVEHNHNITVTLHAGEVISQWTSGVETSNWRGINEAVRSH
jgi:predicted HicB family RNase H-like nuclease